MKIDEYVLEEKSSFKMLGLTFSSKLNWGFYIIFIAQIGTVIRSIKFFSPEVALYSINLPYTHAWNTVVTSGLVSLVSTWNC